MNYEIEKIGETQLGICGGMFYCFVSGMVHTYLLNGGCGWYWFSAFVILFVILCILAWKAEKIIYQEMKKADRRQQQGP